MQNDLYMRVAQTEAMVEALKAQQMETLERAYALACAQKDKIRAAQTARAIRNRLLQESDGEMTLDRLKINTGSMTQLLLSMGKIFSGAWASYRQALRELPEQAGFPFQITFPAKPGEEGTNGESENGGAVCADV